MKPIEFYHASPSRGSIVHWMLEELGEEYNTHLFNLKKGEHKNPDFLKKNPMGKVPTIEYNGEFVSESAAICTLLADEFPDKKLNIPVGDSRRGKYLQHIMFAAGCFEPAICDQAFPRKEDARAGSIGWGNFESVLNYMHLALEAKPYLMGEQFTAADVVLGSCLRWGMMFKVVPEEVDFRAYVDRLEARPALKRAMEKDQKWMEESQ